MQIAAINIHGSLEDGVANNVNIIFAQADYGSNGSIHTMHFKSSFEMVYCLR